MIEKIMKILGYTLLYLAASLFFASILLAGYLWYAWDMNRDKLVKAIAIVQGFDIYGTEEAVREAYIQTANDIHYKEILDERAMRTLNTDMADKVNSETLMQIRVERQTILDSKDEIVKLRDSFEKRLKEIDEASKTEGMTTLTQIYSQIDAELAKRYILDMIEKGEFVKVIYVMENMEPRKRSGIINEMEADEELLKMADVLRRIGNGEPEADLVEAMRQELEQLKKKNQ